MEDIDRFMRQLLRENAERTGFPFPPELLRDFNPFAPRRDGHFDMDSEGPRSSLGGDPMTYGKRSFVLNQLTYGPQYKGTREPSERLEPMLDRLLDRIRRFDETLEQSADEDDEYEDVDSVGDPYMEIDEYFSEPLENNDQTLVVILVELLIPNGEYIEEALEKFDDLLKKPEVEDGSYVLPVDLMVRRLSESLRYPELEEKHSYAVEVINMLLRFTTHTIGYLEPYEFWKNLERALNSATDPLMFENSAELFDAMHNARTHSMFDEKLYVPFLENFGKFEENDQESIIEQVCHAICYAGEDYGEDMAAIGKLLETKPIPKNKISLELGIWALNYGYDEYGYLFGERDFYELMKDFDSEKESDVDKACTIFMAISESAPEKMYDPAALLEKLSKHYFDEEFPINYPNIVDLLCDTCASVVRSAFPVSHQLPGSKVPARGLPLVPQPEAIKRKTPVVYRETIKDGLKTFLVASDFIHNFLFVYEDEEGQIFTAQALINGLNYIRRKENKNFCDAVKKSNLLNQIVSHSRVSGSVEVGSLNTFVECVLECAEEPKLHDHIRGTKVVEVLTSAINYALRTAGSDPIDYGLLRCSSFCKLSLDRLGEVKKKLAAPPPESAVDILKKIGTPQFNVKDLKKFSGKTLLEADFLNKISSQSLNQLLNADMIDVLHIVIGHAIKYTEADFNIPVTDYIDSLKTPGSLLSQSVVQLPVKNCDVPHPETVKALVFSFGSPHEMVEGVKEDAVKGVYKDYPEFEHLLKTKGIKCTWKGKVVPPFYPYCSVLQSETERYNPIFEIEFVDQECEAYSFPEENIYGQNTFSNKVLPPTAATALDTLKKLYNENIMRDYKLPLEAFHNKRLAKLFDCMLKSRVMHYTFTIPQWMFTIMTKYPFTLSMAKREAFLDVTVFMCNYYRHHLVDDLMIPIPFSTGCHMFDRNSHDRDGPQKFRVKRGNLLDSGSTIIAKSNPYKRELEVVFSGEEGKGTGPTAEFFAQLSEAFSDLSNGMWIETPLGLMPKFYGEQVPKHILRRFAALGRLVTRCIFGQHLMDVKISPLFFESLLGWKYNLDIRIRRYDPEIYQTLTTLEKASAEDISAMDLTFIEPRTGTDLIANGSSTAVTKENADKYISALTDAYIGPGISKQIGAFRTGLRGKLCRGNLGMFMPLEWSFICGNKEDEIWDKAFLEQHILTDSKSKRMKTAKRYLVQYLVQLDTIGRRKFLEFTTGSPRLPLGGLAELNPPLMLEILPAPEPNQPDQNQKRLPAAITCGRCLRTPVYDSYEKFETKMNLAIEEGSKYFANE